MNLMLHAASEFPDLMRDESRRTGFADLVAWPTSIPEVSALLRRAAAENLPVTFQGARTGVSAGAPRVTTTQADSNAARTRVTSGPASAITSSSRGRSGIRAILATPPIGVRITSGVGMP